MTLIIDKYQSSANNLRLSEADFWNLSHAAFSKQMKNSNVDWVDIDVRLLGALSRYLY
jgi:hypothetical protein